MYYLCSVKKRSIYPTYKNFLTQMERFKNVAPLSGFVYDLNWATFYNINIIVCFPVFNDNETNLKDYNFSDNKCSNLSICHGI